MGREVDGRVVSPGPEALADREAGVEADGRAEVFRVFERYFLEEDDVEYTDVAKELGITNTDVSNWLMRAKRTYRRSLRDVVAETVDDPEELELEMEWLTGGGP